MRDSKFFIPTGLAVVIAIYLLARLPFLGFPLAGDELATTSLWAQMPLYQIFLNYQYPNNHMFHTFLLGILLKVFGLEEAVLRLPVLIFGMASVILTWRFTRLLTNSATGAMLASGSLALSSSHIFYSTNGRGYILTLAFTGWALWFSLKPWLLEHTQKDTAVLWSRQDLVLLFTVCFLGTWTLPTFGLLEGSLFTFFCLLPLLKDKNKPEQFPGKWKAPAIVLLCSMAGLVVQYFVLLPREMLAVALERTPETQLIEFFSGVMNLWFQPWQEIEPLAILFTVIGLGSLMATRRIIGFAMILTLVLPFVVVYLAVYFGIIQKVPLPRVMLYLQPCVFSCMVTGIIFTFKQLKGNFDFLQKHGPLHKTIILIALIPFIAISFFDISKKYILEKENRIPLHQIHDHIAQLGEHDLVLTSNQPHVEMFLYGGKEIRKRVDRIMESGQLDRIYFLKSVVEGKPDIQQIKKEGQDLFVLKDYFMATDPAKEHPITLPARVLDKTAEFGTWALYQVKPEYVHKEYALQDLNDLEFWDKQNLPDLKIDFINTPSGKRPAITYSKPFHLVSKFRPSPAEADLKLDFLYLANTDQPNAFYFSGTESSSGFKYDPTWLGNVWILDHPYGIHLFGLKWKPLIFISESNGAYKLLNAGKFDRLPQGTIWGLLSYRISLAPPTK